jgi:hypothetical protein
MGVNGGALEFSFSFSKFEIGGAERDPGSPATGMRDAWMYG